MRTLPLQVIDESDGWGIDRLSCYKQGRDGFPAGKPFAFG